MKIVFYTIFVCEILVFNKKYRQYFLDIFIIKEKINSKIVAEKNNMLSFFIPEKIIEVIIQKETWKN